MNHFLCGDAELRERLALAKTHLDRAKKLSGYVDRDINSLSNTVDAAINSRDASNISVDYIDEVGMRATRNINLAATEMQFVLREVDPDRPESVERSQCIAPVEDGYDAIADETGIYVKVPLAPISSYRSDARSKRTAQFCMTKKRYKFIVPRIVQLCNRPIPGRKLVDICHVFHREPAFRTAPDFDNFDVKDLIDCVMDFYGGDGVNNIAYLCHEAVLRTDIDEGTYLAVRPFNPDMAVGELQGQAFEHFMMMNA